MGSENPCCKTDAMEEKENGLHGYDLEGSVRCDDKLLKASEALNSNKITEKSLVEQSSCKISCSPDKGKRVLQGSEVEHINERLKILEEEFTVVKQAFFKGVKERKQLINEIHRRFHFILHFRNQGTEKTPGERSLTAKTPKVRRAGTGLSQVLHQNSNPFLVNRDHIHPGTGQSNTYI